MPQGYRAQPFLLAVKDTWLPLVHRLLLHSDDSSEDDDGAEQSPFLQLFNRAFVRRWAVSREACAQEFV